MDKKTILLLGLIVVPASIMLIALSLPFSSGKWAIAAVILLYGLGISISLYLLDLYKKKNKR